MTTVAIVLLVATAVSSAVPAVLRTRVVRHHELPRHALLVDVVTTAVTTALAAAAAIVAAAAGPALGTGLVVATCAALTAAIAGGGFVVRLVLRVGGVPAVHESDDSPDTGIGEPDTAGPHTAEADTTGPLRGGRVIGYLERGAVAATLLVGWPEGLAVILAVKSLARYPELRAPHASEQFIMGTFASVLWATGMAGIGYLVGH
ncbi:hypothetical protein QSJ19_10895 [Gordonia sp. ABSL11-1]|uniref:hypothetical protein n=1 Tax=Gordonia sp. ABSL11-1 TaxID=3053924 RepID=UPI00257340E0|nr:hypothetical protein [Gordonia sp. ABSL11-1]MDL9946091.1 hypothetical protein [Gordonia sp. ABSL11-1]